VLDRQPDDRLLLDQRVVLPTYFGIFLKGVRVDGARGKSVGVANGVTVVPGVGGCGIFFIFIFVIIGARCT